jgi:hypothetical protein
MRTSTYDPRDFFFVLEKFQIKTNEKQKSLYDKNYYRNK